MSVKATGIAATGSFVLALVVGALIGVLSAGFYLFVVQDPITAERMGVEDRAALA